MNEITREQAFALVDHAASTDALYHYNGAYAYIRIAPDCDVMLIVDTASEQPTAEAYDGSLYLELNKGANIACSARNRETNYVQWWEDYKKEIA